MKNEDKNEGGGSYYLAGFWLYLIVLFLTLGWMQKEMLESGEG
jgi:hypothetical protein